MPCIFTITSTDETKTEVIYLQEGCFSDSCEWCAFFFLQPDLLQRHNLIRQTGITQEVEPFT